MKPSLRPSPRDFRARRLRRSPSGLASLLLFILPAVAIGVSGLAAAGGSQSKRGAAAASPLAEDKGRFRILLDGQLMGSEEFEISRAGSEWTARGSTEVRLPAGPQGTGGSAGGSTRVSARMRLAADGALLHYEWTSQGQKKASATVEFQGATAKMVLQLEGAQPFVQELTFGSPRVVILDNNLYHHYAILARVYDWNAKGAQTLPVLIPQEMTPGSITVESLGAQQVEGVTYETLRVQSADLEIQLFLDSSHRLMRLAVPPAKALIVRE